MATVLLSCAVITANQNQPPSPAIWHQTAVAARIIADIHRLAEMSQAYIDFARGPDGAYRADATADTIGSLDRDGSSLSIGTNRGTWLGTGMIGRMLDRLVDERSAWIDEEYLRRLRFSGAIMDSDQGEDIYHDVNGAADTASSAIDAWLLGHRRMAA